jgi:DNA-binding SARP family transcriptional activator
VTILKLLIGVTILGSLEIKLLGEFNLRLDNLPLTHLKSQKGKALFCYLAVTGKRVSRSKLAGFLWPDMPETKALMNLRKVLTRIKPLFPYLKITRTELSFRQDVPYWLDTVEFERQASKTAEIPCLQDAVNLYQGDFLDGFYLDHVPLFEEWMMAQRARLRELAINTLDMLITQLSNQGAYEAAIPYTRQM